MIRRFTSGPNPSPRVSSYESRRLARLMRVAVFDAVKAREVRGAFGGRDDVVGRQRVLRVRQRDRHDLRAEPLKSVDRGAHRRLHRRVHALDEILRGHADAQAA